MLACAYPTRIRIQHANRIRQAFYRSCVTCVRLVTRPGLLYHNRGLVKSRFCHGLHGYTIAKRVRDLFRVRNSIGPRTLGQTTTSLMFTHTFRFLQVCVQRVFGNAGQNCRFGYQTKDVGTKRGPIWVGALMDAYLVIVCA